MRIIDHLWCDNNLIEWRLSLDRNDNDWNDNSSKRRDSKNKMEKTSNTPGVIPPLPQIPPLECDDDYDIGDIHDPHDPHLVLEAIRESQEIFSSSWSGTSSLDTQAVMWLQMKSSSFWNSQ